MFVLEEDNVFDGQPKKDSYDVHNLYAQWVPSDIDGLSVTFGIDNVFDELYTSHASRSGTAEVLLWMITSQDVTISYRRLINSNIPK